jgi:hypothetical protein
MMMVCCGMAVNTMGSECEEDEGTEHEDGDSYTDWQR